MSSANRGFYVEPGTVGDSVMASSNQGVKFRRVSSNKNHARSASTGNILNDSLPSYPEAVAYNGHQIAGPNKQQQQHPKVQRHSSSSQGGSFNPLHITNVVGYSAYSITGAASLDSVNPTDYEHRGGERLVPYTRSHSEGRPRGSREGSIGPSEGRRRPPPPLYDSSHESFQSNRGLGPYTRHSHHMRDSTSQDTMGEREFDYQMRYNANTSTTLPTLSLQDAYHTAQSAKKGARERAMSVDNDRDLRRNPAQEFQVPRIHEEGFQVPRIHEEEFQVQRIHEAFTHNAMIPSATSTPSAHLSPRSPQETSSNNNSRGGSSGGMSPLIIDRQPQASLQQPPNREGMQSPHSPQERFCGDNHQHITYHPVFFSPESGQLLMRVDGSYKPLPNQDYTDIPRAASLNQSDQRLSVHRFSATELSGRQTSSSFGMSAPYDYFHCSVVMMVIYFLCLNLVVVFALSFPAIWFSRKAMQARYEGDYARTLSLGTKALCLNVIAGCIHILFLCALIIVPILIQFVFNE